MTTFHTKHISPTGRKSIREVEGQRFGVTIDGTRVWLFVHQAYDAPDVLRVSDVRTGLQIFDVGALRLAATKGNKVQAAKNTFRSFIAGRDQAHVLKVIKSAPDLKEGVAA